MSEESRPTWIRIDRKYILPETLDAYRLPWDYDPEDDDYVLIKEYIDHELQREIFEHTKRLRASRGQPGPTMSELKSGRSTVIVSEKPWIYLAPIDGSGQNLDLEINIADENRPASPQLAAKSVIELIAQDTHLQSRFGIRHLLKASIMTAHQRPSSDSSLGTTVEYFESPNRVPDTHFRWLHVRTSSDFDRYQLFLTQLSEIDNDEKALMLALLRSFESDLINETNAVQPASFRIRRASAKRGRARDQPTKWVLFLSTLHLAENTFGHRNGLCIPFSKYRQLLKGLGIPYNQNRLQSTHQLFPANDLNVVLFSAFMTSTGFLVTFSPESLESLCPTSMSIQKLDSLGGLTNSRKIRLYSPDGAAFHVSPDLCDTFFALKNTAVALCNPDSTGYPDDYALFTADDEEIKAGDWQRYRSTQSSTYLEVHVRIMFPEPQRVTDELERGIILAGKDLDFDSHDKFSTQFKSEPDIMGDEEPSREHRNSFQIEPLNESGIHTKLHPPKKSVSFAKSVLSSQNNEDAVITLPSNRMLRTRDLSGDTIVNFDLDDSEPNDVFFQTSSNQDFEAEGSINQDSQLKTKPTRLSEQSEATTPNHDAPNTAFFLWPLGDPANVQTKESPSRGRAQVIDILNDINASLTQGNLGTNYSDGGREHFSRLYNALEPQDDLLAVSEDINKGLAEHEHVKNEEIADGNPSWQRLLFEVIRRWDSIVKYFYAGDLEHVVLGKFRYARAEFYTHISRVCERQYGHYLKVAGGDLLNPSADHKPFYVVDYSHIMDARIPAPDLPEIPITGCQICQYSGRPQACVLDRSDAVKHLHEHHFKSTQIVPSLWVYYVVTDNEINDIMACIEARYLLLLILDHLKEIVNLLTEIQKGTTTSTQLASIYRLPKSLVQAFTQFIGTVVYAADVSLTGTFVPDKSSNEDPVWEDLQFARRHADRISASGVVVEFSLNTTKNDLMLMNRIGDFSTTVSYAVVDSPYILLSVLGSLMERNNSTEGLHLQESYLDCVSLLERQIERRPGRRIQSDIIKLKSEIQAVGVFVRSQKYLMERFINVLKPQSFRATTKRRKGQHKLETMLHEELMARCEAEDREFASLYRLLDELQGDNLRAVEILQDDQGKAILVLTTVTVIFLPLSFVASLLGMNTSDIRNLSSSQWLFWAIALPLTFVTTFVVMLLGYWKEEIRELLIEVIPSFGVVSNRAPEIKVTPTTYDAGTDKGDTRLDPASLRNGVSLGRTRRRAPEKAVWKS